MGATNVTKEVVELSAIDNASRVIQGVQGAAQKLGATYDGLISKMGSLGLAVAGLGSLGAFGAMIKSTIEGEAALLRLSEKTGNTVEALSSLGRVAKMSNTEMDEIAKGMQKLAKAMTEAESGTGKAGKVFDALGISVRDASTGALKPTQIVMQELGQKLMAMKDQTLAVAFAQEVLGKAGANLLPFLYELARAGELQVKVTTEQAKQAKEFEDNIIRLESASKQFWRHLANDMLPTLNKYLEQLIEGKKIFGGWLAAMAGAGTMNPFKTPGEAIGTANADLASLQGMKGIPAYTEGTPEFRADIDRQIQAAQKRKQWAQYLQRQDALDATNGMDTGDQNSRRFGPKALNVNNPFAGEAGGAGGADYTQLFAVYEMQLKAEKELKQLAKDRADEEERLRKIKEQITSSQITTEMDFAKALQRMREGTLGDEENVGTSVHQWGEEMKKTDDVAHQLGLTLSSAAGKAVQNFGSLREVVRGLAADIAQMVFKSTVLNPLEKSIESSLKGFDFSFGLFGGGKAAGGPVMDGMTYLVGENGPELFTPGSAGNITPNGAGGGVGAIYIDARGADAGVEARIMAQLRKLSSTVESRAVAAWQRASNSRGYSTAVG